MQATDSNSALPLGDVPAPASSPSLKRKRDPRERDSPTPSVDTKDGGGAAVAVTAAVTAAAGGAGKLDDHDAGPSGRKRASSSAMQRRTQGNDAGFVQPLHTVGSTQNHTVILTQMPSNGSAPTTLPTAVASLSGQSEAARQARGAAVDFLNNCTRVCRATRATLHLVHENVALSACELALQAHQAEDAALLHGAMDAASKLKAAMDEASAMLEGL